MAICYLALTVEVHGLSLKTQGELDALLKRFTERLLEAHPGRESLEGGVRDEDVEIEVEEHAGQLEDTVANTKTHT